MTLGRLGVGVNKWIHDRQPFWPSGEFRAGEGKDLISRGKMGAGDGSLLEYLDGLVEDPG